MSIFHRSIATLVAVTVSALNAVAGALLRALEYVALRLRPAKGTKPATPPSSNRMPIMRPYFAR